MAARTKKRIEPDLAIEHDVFDAVIGIDTSLTATGVAVVHWGYADDEPGKPRWETGRIKSDPVPDTITWRSRRLAKMIGEFPALMPSVGGHYLAVIEEPTYTSGGSGFDRAHLWHGIVRFILQNGHHVIQVNNSTGKIYAVGRASSPAVEKGEILAQVMKHHPGADIIDDNVADAVNLAALGARLIGRPVEQIEMTQTRLRALDTVRKRLGL